MPPARPLRASPSPASSKKRGPPLVEREERIALDPSGALRLAVIADTHSHPHPNAEALIGALKVDAILHGGDIGDLSVLDRFAKLARVIAVRGNIDGRDSDLPDVVALDVRAGDQSALKLMLMHIVVYGPKIRADAAQLAARHEARMIVCGHSHVPFVGRDRGLTVFNPGSIGPRRMHLPIVFGMLEIADGKLSLRHVDCETGQTWTP